MTRLKAGLASLSVLFINVDTALTRVVAEFPSNILLAQPLPFKDMSGVLRGISDSLDTRDLLDGHLDGHDHHYGRWSRLVLVLVIIMSDGTLASE